MRVDQFDLLVLWHLVGDGARPLEHLVSGSERAGGRQPGEEPWRALEQRRRGSGEVLRWAALEVDHQPPASRTSRCSTRAATILR